MSRKHFLFTTQLDLPIPELFSELCISQGYMQNFKRNWKNSIYIRVSTSTKSINFSISRESSQRKKENLSKLEYYYLRGKVNFNGIHTIHITIYSF